MNLAVGLAPSTSGTIAINTQHIPVIDTRKTFEAAAADISPIADANCRVYSPAGTTIGGMEKKYAREIIQP